MSARRVVEYLVVAGIVERKGSEASITSGSGWVGEVLQSFPSNGRPTVALPAGIELFCQPHGWEIVTKPPSPYFIPFILTSETGTRLYCVSLNFYQQRRQPSPEVSNMNELDAAMVNAPVMPQHRRLTGTQSVMSGTSITGDDLDVHWDVDMMDGGSCSPIIEFEPVSLCAISVQPLLSTLKHCLRGVYASWMNGEHVLEDVVAKMLTEVKLPLSGMVTLSLGSLRELILPSFDERTSLPLTTTECIHLLRSIGVHNLITLLLAILMDESVLFISSSYGALTGAIRALLCLVYPFVLPYSLVPIVPRDILEYVQLPSTYIMGVPSQYSDELPESLEVIQVFLDDSRVEVPQSTEMLPLPYGMHQHLEMALNRIIDPSYEYRDSAFPPAIDQQLPSVEYQDKQVRAAFLCTILSLIGDYYNHITVLKLCPEPSIAFNKKSFIAAHKEDEDTVFTKMADSLVFQNFIQLKAVPYRICDYADDLMAELVQEDKIDLDVLYSTESLNRITRKIANLLLCDKLESRSDVTSLYDISIELLNTKATRKTFPMLDADKINDICDKSSDDSSEVGTGLCRLVPIVEKLKESHHKTMKRYSSAVNNEIDLLKKCLDALFENKIYEARRFIPFITQSFKNDAVARLFVPELVHRLTVYGGFLGQEQFDILVKLMNSAMVHEPMAARLLPLSTAFYRELCPGTTQQAYSCMQNHLMWESKQFWRDTMYKAIQTELVRIHTEPDTAEGQGTDPQDQQQHFRRRLTQLNEEGDTDDEILRYCEEEIQPRKKLVSRTKSDTAVMNQESQPIRQRRQLQHSATQQKLRITQRISLLSRSVKMRMRASTVMPGAAEGVAPPDARPVTVHEALEVLGTQQMLWNELSAEKQQEKIKQEENAVFNQVVLFISRVIWLRCPLEFHEGDPFWETFAKDLGQFLDEILRSIEVDVRLDSKLFSKIREMIQGLISLHIASLDNQLRNLKKLPESSRMKIIKPPFLQGEAVLTDCVRTFLLPDGRDDCNLLPAEGYFFVTSYRLIFLGTPCDPNQPNTLVTRAMPVTALYQLKKINAQSFPAHGISIVEGLQLRSLTGQLIKIGFDDETALNAKKLHQEIVTRKHPRRIVLALLSNDTTEGDEVDATGHLRRHLSDTKKFNNLLMQQSPSVRRRQQSVFRKSKVVRQGATITKSSSFSGDEDAMSLQSILRGLSLTPVCHEYERMQVGDIKKEQDKSDHSIWRLSTVNAQYGVCSSYPAVVAVPSSVSDDVVISLSSQFEESRFPVVTWRHPTSKAVILRSSTFSETTGVSYHKGRHGDSEQAVLGIPNGPMPTRGAARQVSAVHLGGSGIYHASMERLLLGVVMCVKNMESHEHSRSLSDTEFFGTDEFDEYSPMEEGPPTPPQRSKRKVTITRSYSEKLKDNMDYERGGYSTDEPEGPTFSRETAQTSPDPLGVDQPPRKLHIRTDSSRNIDVVKSPTHFSTLPTSPRDWVTVEALPHEMSHWKTSPVYIIADKDVLRKVPPTLYANCTFLPVEGRQYKDIHLSFKKLMRACSPSSPSGGAFLGAVDDSEWLNQLSNLLQLSGAIVDLVDLQRSSILVALEKGWDYTAQVVSLSQLLLDPYYRTIDGFRQLIEKDWIAFGHPFSQRNNLTTESVSQDVAPVFLQFLDCVHQVLMQFPVAFEFNDFYLRMMAYHSSSMRFHTFALNSDKERSEQGWQDYQVAWTRSKSVRADGFSSFWTFINSISKESMMFHNFNYSPNLNKDITVLRPQSFVANLDIWSYYLENHLCRFIPYDPEFICHRNLTLSDIHHKFFNAPKTWESLIPADSQFISLVKLIHQCTEVTNEIHVINKLPTVTWNELVWHFEEKLKDGTSSQDEVDASIRPLIPARNFITKKHNKVLHNKTSMAVLIKSRLSVEAERNFIHPHNFVQVEVSKKKQCNFCKHTLHQKTAFQCTGCEGWYHHYCRNLVPYNCGVKFLDPAVEDVKLEPMPRMRTGSSLFYTNHKSTIFEGHLYKKGKMVKSWKLRWFVLDLESKVLSYYDSRNDTKVKGTVDMSEVMSVHILMNQTANPAPALKAGEKGYYFQLITQKRTYQMMSLQEPIRHEWMSKLKQCAGIL